MIALRGVFCVEEVSAVAPRVPAARVRVLCVDSAHRDRGCQGVISASCAHQSRYALSSMSPTTLLLTYSSTPACGYPHLY